MLSVHVLTELVAVKRPDWAIYNDTDECVSISMFFHMLSKFVDSCDWLANTIASIHTTRDEDALVGIIFVTLKLVHSRGCPVAASMRATKSRLSGFGNIS